MGRTVTPEMKKAIRLITRKVNPLSPYAAAKAVGIETSTIYRSKLYQDAVAGITPGKVTTEFLFITSKIKTQADLMQAIETEINGKLRRSVLLKLVNFDYSKNTTE